MDNEKNIKNILNDETLLIINNIEKKYSNYICGYSHNINSPLSGVVSRIELLEFKVDKAMQEIENNNQIIALEKIKKIKEELVKMTAASQDLSQLMINIQNFASYYEETEPSIFSILGKLKELIFFLECNLNFKHNIKIKIENQLSKRTLNGFAKNFISPVQHILEEIIDYLPDIITSHTIEITLHNTNKQLLLDFNVIFGEDCIIPSLDNNRTPFPLASSVINKVQGELIVHSYEKISLILPI